MVSDSDLKALLDEIMPLVEGKCKCFCHDPVKSREVGFGKDVGECCPCSKIESKCCPKCNFKRTAHDSDKIVFFGEEYCGDTNCACHRLSNGATGHQKEEVCGALIHTRGWEGAPGPIYCANKKPCHLHEQKIELVSHPLEEGWEKEFEELFGDAGKLEDGMLRLWAEKAKEKIKQFFSQTLAQERRNWEINESAEWINNVRQEERAKVVEQVDELWTSMEEQKAKTKAGSPARQFCRGATAAYKEILSLLSDLQVNKEK